MPGNDLVLNVRQIANYTPITSAPTSASILMQTAGLGSPYASISPAAFVGTALSAGGDMTIAGQLQVGSINGGTAQLVSADVNVFTAQTASVADFSTTFGTLAGVQIATVDDVSALGASLQASTVWSVNGRRGDVTLTWLDVPGAAPIYAPRFTGSPRAETPPPWSCSSRLATTAFVHGAIAQYLAAFPTDHPFVFTFNGRTGDVVLTAADIEAAGTTFAPIDSPDFTGVPQGPTAAQGSSTSQLATTAFVMNAVTDTSRVNKAGDTMSGTLHVNLPSANWSMVVSPAAGAAAIQLNGSGSSQSVNGCVNGYERWDILFGDTTQETGANAGSNFLIRAWNDAGTTVTANAISIVRATGVTTFSAPIVNGPSDQALKENVTPIDGALGKVMALNGVEFTMVGDASRRRQIGLIAQEVAPIVPEIIQPYVQPDQPERLALDYPKLTALLIEAVKELRAQIGALETRMAA